MANPYEKQETIEKRNLQIVYLKTVKKWDFKEIAELVQLAVGTVKTYFYKFYQLIDQAKSLFEQTINKIKQARKSKYDDNIEYECEPTTEPCAYIIEMYSGDNLVWLKVGKTIRLKQRMKEILSHYQKTEHKISNIKVKEVITTLSEDRAENIESALRTFAKELNPTGFVRNDRFTGMSYKDMAWKTSEYVNGIIQATKLRVC